MTKYLISLLISLFVCTIAHCQNELSKVRKEIAGNYLYINNSLKAEMYRYGKYKRVLQIKDDNTFSVYYLSSKDTAELESGKWYLNADTLVMNFVKTLIPLSRKQNCYTGTNGETECYGYEEYVVRNKKLYWWDYSLGDCEKASSWYIKRKYLKALFQ